MGHGLRPARHLTQGKGLFIPAPGESSPHRSPVAGRLPWVPLILLHRDVTLVSLPAQPAPCRGLFPVLLEFGVEKGGVPGAELNSLPWVAGGRRERSWQPAVYCPSSARDPRCQSFSLSSRCFLNKLDIPSRTGGQCPGVSASVHWLQSAPGFCRPDCGLSSTLALWFFL